MSRWTERRWNGAIAEHESAVREFLEVCGRCSAADWHRAPAHGKWSTAAVALHVCRTYELGQTAAEGGGSMRLLVPRRMSWLLRTVMLPVVLATSKFPRGVRAPKEVAPDLEEAEKLTPEIAAARLARAADAASAAVRRVAQERGAPSFTHAYFGRLSPYTALRLLSAHTRHHSRALAVNLPR